MRTGQLIDWRERERVKVNNGSDAREAVVRKARHAISSSLRWWHCWLGVIAGHERSRNALDVWRGILSWRKLGRVYQERKKKTYPIEVRRFLRLALVGAGFLLECIVRWQGTMRVAVIAAVRRQDFNHLSWRRLYYCGLGRVPCRGGRDRWQRRGPLMPNKDVIRLRSETGGARHGQGGRGLGWEGSAVVSPMVIDWVGHQCT